MAGWTNRLADRQNTVVAGAAKASSRGEGNLLRGGFDPGAWAACDAGDRSAMIDPASTRLPGYVRSGPGGAPPQLVASNTSTESELSRVVELEIIPRLMLMHGSVLRERQPSNPSGLALTTQHIHTLAHLAVQGDADSVGIYVRGLLDAGASREQVFLDLLAPCARWIGDRWSEDVYNFSQVTIALWRLQRVLHQQGSLFNDQPAARVDGHRLLMAATPGDQHTFGVCMAAEFFVQAGWDVDYEPQASWSELCDRVASGWFDVFGLSVATSDQVSKCADGLADIRKASRNPDLFVMVGGPLTALVPDVDRLCGADAAACYASEAVEIAARAVGRRIGGG